MDLLIQDQTGGLDGPYGGDRVRLRATVFRRLWDSRSTYIGSTERPFEDGDQ